MDEEDEEDAAANGGGDDEEEEKVSTRKTTSKPAAAAAAAGGDEDASMEDAAPAPEQSQYAKMKALFDKKKDDKYMTFDADDPLKPNPSQYNTHTAESEQAEAERCAAGPSTSDAIPGLWILLRGRSHSLLPVPAPAFSDKKRAAEREDEELAEDGEKDPWLLQARDDSARAAEQAADPAAHFNTHPAHKSKTPLVASTAVFESDDAAPIFDQAQARLVLLKHMQPGETVLKAVKRLGAPSNNAAANGAKGGATAAAPHTVKTKMKNVRSKPKEDAAAAAAPVAAAVDPVAEKARKAAFEELTEAAQGFLSSGYVGEFISLAVWPTASQPLASLLMLLDCVCLCSLNVSCVQRSIKMRTRRSIALSRHSVLTRRRLHRERQLRPQERKRCRHLRLELMHALVPRPDCNASVMHARLDCLNLNRAMTRKKITRVHDPLLLLLHPRPPLLLPLPPPPLPLLLHLLPLLAVCNGCTSTVVKTRMCRVRSPV